MVWVYTLEIQKAHITIFVDIHRYVESLIVLCHVKGYPFWTSEYRHWSTGLSHKVLTRLRMPWRSYRLDDLKRKLDNGLMAELGADARSCLPSPRCLCWNVSRSTSALWGRNLSSDLICTWALCTFWVLLERKEVTTLRGVVLQYQEKP